MVPGVFGQPVQLQPFTHDKAVSATIALVVQIVERQKKGWWGGGGDGS